MEEVLISKEKINYPKLFLKNSSILDLGAGQGLYSRWFVKNYPKINLIALDKFIPVDGVGERFEFVQYDLENGIPFSNNFFDTIIAFDVIEHVFNEELLWWEIYRVCKPGGVIIGSVPHDDGFLPRYNITFYHRSDLTHKRYYLKQDLIKKAEDVGFKVIRIEGKGGVPPHVFSEFFLPFLKPVVFKFIGLLRCLRMVASVRLMSDLFFVFQK